MVTFVFSGDFHSSMSQLLIFWRSHQKSYPGGHQCEWLSLIFIEQDDDMWEAAKALLLIYLKLDRLVRCVFLDGSGLRALLLALWLPRLPGLLVPPAFLLVLI